MGGIDGQIGIDGRIGIDERTKRTPERICECGDGGEVGDDECGDGD
jgi:hypothetical protein